MNRTSTAVLAATILIGVAGLAQAETGHATAAASTGTSATAASHTQTSTATHATKHKEELNSASREELMKLPGVSEATADKIIAARPFKSKDELVSKKILTQKEYSAISSHVMVKSASQTASKTSK